jgi:hypothetical protein
MPNGRSSSRRPLRCLFASITPRPSLRAAAFLVGLCGLTGCRSRPTPPTADALAHQYVSLSIQLGARDFDSLDFDADANPAFDQLQRDPEPIAALHRDAQALRAQLVQLPGDTSAEASRKSMLLAQADAIILRTEQLQGHNRSFDEESRIFFGVGAPVDNDAMARKAIRGQLAKLLGDSANPAAAYTHYEAQFVVLPSRVPAVLNAALGQCRAITLAHIALPPGEHVDIEYVTHKPWSGFSRYLGHAHSLIQINMDYPLTVDRLLDLACHEGYPGHHVFNSIRDEAVAQGLHREEFLVQPTFSPQSYVSEAAASYAPSMLLPADRLRIERDILFPLAGLKNLDVKRYLQIEDLVAQLHTAEPSIARDFLDGNLEFVRAADALERETLMEHGETVLLYLNEFRSYMLAYTIGNDAMQARIEGGHPSDAERWQRYIDLMKSPVVSLPTPNQ